jgi:hypothetical protein
MLEVVCRSSLKRVMLAIGIDIIEDDVVSKRRTFIRDGGCVGVSHEDFFGYVISAYGLRVNPAPADWDFRSETT